MKDYTTDSPEFSESIGKFETTDPAHADLFNGVTTAIFQNTLVLKNALGQDMVEQAFYKAFPDAQQKTTID